MLMYMAKAEEWQIDNRLLKLFSKSFCILADNDADMQITYDEFVNCFNTLVDWKQVILPTMAHTIIEP